eukprot:TRINITY_DN956_c0_g1_i19.p1 TRINITY_DN956_c0_g1~~TRINITY_DN956_c0_g1_i19.p1  ORF type:complete len:1066 (+),score=255.53 TRINITY_DN956_c0_g1_i19:101-3298(+)
MFVFFFFFLFFFFFFFKQKTAYEMLRSLVGSEMCIRDRCNTIPMPDPNLVRGGFPLQGQVHPGHKCDAECVEARSNASLLVNVDPNGNFGNCGMQMWRSTDPEKSMELLSEFWNLNDPGHNTGFPWEQYSFNHALWPEHQDQIRLIEDTDEFSNPMFTQPAGFLKHVVGFQDITHPGTRKKMFLESAQGTYGLSFEAFKKDYQLLMQERHFELSPTHMGELANRLADRTWNETKHMAMEPDSTPLEHKTHSEQSPPKTPEEEAADAKKAEEEAAAAASAAFWADEAYSLEGKQADYTRVMAVAVDDREAEYKKLKLEIESRKQDRAARDDESNSDTSSAHKAEASELLNEENAAVKKEEENAAVGWTPGPPSIHIARLVPPGQVMLRWSPAPEPQEKPTGWRISRYNLLAFDTSTQTQKNFTLSPPSPPAAGHRESPGKHHWKTVMLGDQLAGTVYHEYRFRKYTLDAGFFEFQLSACAEDTDALEDVEFCSEFSAPSSPLVPVPGHTVADFKGDQGQSQPGVPAGVKAKVEVVQGKIQVHITWQDPVPNNATAFVVLASLDSDKAGEGERFPVSPRLYANRREYDVTSDKLTTSDIDCQDACYFKFQVAAISVMTHGRPSNPSDRVRIWNISKHTSAVQSDQKMATPGRVQLHANPGRDAHGRVVVSWSYSGNATGFQITCIKKAIPTICTGELGPKSRSFAFDRSMLEDDVYYTFQVGAMNLGHKGPLGESTNPTHTNWKANSSSVSLGETRILDKLSDVRTEYHGGDLKILWEQPSIQGGGVTTQVAVKKHDEAVWRVLQDKIESNQFVVTNLEELVQYDFALAMVNSVGAGPWTEPVSAKFGARHPGVPLHPTKAGPGSEKQKLDRITIGWGLPEDDGGLPIDNYRITVLSEDQETSKAAAHDIQVGKRSHFRVEGLHPSTRYTFRVAAHNEVGWSSVSEPSPLYSTASEVAPTSDYWVKQMKKTLAICVTVFVVVALICGVCIYMVYRQQEQEGQFESQPNAWQEFKPLVRAEKSTFEPLIALFASRKPGLVVCDVVLASDQEQSSDKIGKGGTTCKHVI